MKNHQKPTYGSIEVAKQVGISLRQLYHWVDVLEVVQPVVCKHGARQFRHFSGSDLKHIKRMSQLVEQGYTPRAAVKLARGTQGNGR